MTSKTCVVIVLILGWCCVVSDSKVQNYNQYKVLKVTPNDRDRPRVTHFLESRVSFWTEPLVANSTIDFMVPPWNFKEVMRYLRRNQIHTQFMFQDLQSVIASQIKEEVDQPKIDSDALRRRDRNRPPIRRQSIWGGFMNLIFGVQESSESVRVPRKNNQGLGNNDLPLEYPAMNWQRYHRLGTIYQFMQDLAKQFPHLVEVFSIGKSFEGRDLLVAKVGKKQNYEKPAIFIEGGIHAREWISPATVTFILRQLVLNYDLNQDIVNFYDVYILPVMNPDGYEFTHTKDRLWRKNRSKAPISLGNLFPGCVGVDLNRNFGFHWAEPSIKHIRGGSSLPCVETYQGESPFSESESRAVSDFVFSKRHLIVIYLSYHSYGEKIVYPWSYTAQPVYDVDDLHPMAIEMSNAIFDESLGKKRFEVGSSPFVQYSASGGSDDWVKGSAAVKWVFLLELPDKGKYGFLLPAKQIVPTARAGLAALRAVSSKS